MQVCYSYLALELVVPKVDHEEELNDESPPHDA